MSYARWWLNSTYYGFPLDLWKCFSKLVTNEHSSQASKYLCFGGMTTLWWIRYIIKEQFWYLCFANTSIFWIKPNDYLWTAIALTTLLPGRRANGALYTKVTSRPSTFLFHGLGFFPFVVKYSRAFGVSIITVFMWRVKKKKREWSWVHKIYQVFS